MNLDSYTTGIELAFAINLLFSTWDVVYRQLETHQNTLTKGADDLDNDENIQEELSIQRLRKTIEIGRVLRRGLWNTGRVTGWFSAIFLYLVIWLVPLSTTRVDDWAWMPLLYVSAFGFPIIVILMVAVSFPMNRWADSQLRDLENLREKKKQQSRKELKDLRRAMRVFLSE